MSFPYRWLLFPAVCVMCLCSSRPRRSRILSKAMETPTPGKDGKPADSVTLIPFDMFRGQAAGTAQPLSPDGQQVEEAEVQALKAQVKAVLAAADVVYKQDPEARLEAFQNRYAAFCLRLSLSLFHTCPPRSCAALLCPL